MLDVNTNFVLVLPEINHHLVDVTVNETHNVNFVCQAIGEPFPNIGWYFNGMVLNLSNTLKYNSHSFTLNENILAFLTIISAQSSDVGTYTCQAENIIGSDQTSGILTVNGTYTIIEWCVNEVMFMFTLLIVAAELTEPSAGQTRYVEEGNNITFRCVGEGYPPPLVQWRNLNGLLSDRTSNSSMLMSTNEGNVTRVTVDLIFTGAYREDTGVYECSVSNLLSTETGMIQLVVQCM